MSLFFALICKKKKANLCDLLIVDHGFNHSARLCCINTGWNLTYFESKSRSVARGSEPAPTPSTTPPRVAVSLCLWPCGTLWLL